MTTNKNWTVYVVKCADGTFYTGCTNDLKQRLRKHTQGKGAKYTRGRSPIKLVHQENDLTHSQALKREHQIKQLTRQEKNILVDKSTSN